MNHVLFLYIAGTLFMCGFIVAAVRCIFEKSVARLQLTFHAAVCIILSYLAAWYLFDGYKPFPVQVQWIANTMTCVIGTVLIFLSFALLSMASIVSHERVVAWLKYDLHNKATF